MFLNLLLEILFWVKERPTKKAREQKQRFRNNKVNVKHDVGIKKEKIIKVLANKPHHDNCLLHYVLNLSSDKKNQFIVDDSFWVSINRIVNQLSKYSWWWQYKFLQLFNIFLRHFSLFKVCTEKWHSQNPTNRNAIADCNEDSVITCITCSSIVSIPL